MIADPRYTSLASVKAAGPGVETGEHSGAQRPACDTGVFFTPAVSPSMADRAWHPSTRWPAPESGFLPIHDLSPIFVEKDGDGSKSSTLESAMPANPSPLLQQAADALNNVYFLGRHHNLRSAIDERLALTTGLAEHLAESFDNAAHFRVDLNFRNLYSAMTLLHRELQAIDALWNVMCDDAAPEVTTPQTT